MYLNLYIFRTEGRNSNISRASKIYGNASNDDKMKVHLINHKRNDYLEVNQSVPYL